MTLILALSIRWNHLSWVHLSQKATKSQTTSQYKTIPLLINIFALSLKERLNSWKCSHKVKSSGPSVASILRGCWIGAGAISQKQLCVTSYFKGGVESWRVARTGQDSSWGLGLVPQAPRVTEAHSNSSRPEPGHWFMGQGITIKPSMRTTQMVAEDNSRTNTHVHIHISDHNWCEDVYPHFCKNPEWTQSRVLKTKCFHWGEGKTKIKLSGN